MKTSVSCTQVSLLRCAHIGTHLPGSAESRHPSLFVLKLQGRSFCVTTSSQARPFGLEVQGRPKMRSLGPTDPSSHSSASAAWAESDRHFCYCGGYRRKLQVHTITITGSPCLVAVSIWGGNFSDFFSRLHNSFYSESTQIRVLPSFCQFDTNQSHFERGTINWKKAPTRLASGQACGDFL